MSKCDDKYIGDPKSALQNTEELIVDLRGLVSAAKLYQRAMEGIKFN